MGIWCLNPFVQTFRPELNVSAGSGRSLSGSDQLRSLSELKPCVPRWPVYLGKLPAAELAWLASHRPMRPVSPRQVVGQQRDGLRTVAPPGSRTSASSPHEYVLPPPSGHRETVACPVSNGSSIPNIFIVVCPPVLLASMCFLDDVSHFRVV